ncbi:alpha/beta family hydrolase [Rhodococcus sp. X156]|uniref:alpha/beta hydrolase family protein n=1 Tax=Rhodococcus sp. X156 TaxID=2499145 RepID=UPI001F49F921|nr:alpha/beta family hydrolase [Rhodococcus sp. X156]
MDTARHDDDPTPSVVTELETPHGPARAHLHHPAGPPRAALVLGHGAGGGVSAADLRAVTATAVELDVLVVLVEQPYRVAGRRAPAPAKQLDTAWLSVLTQLREGPLRDLPLVVGGRSSGARVACRTAGDAGALGVLCLAFPLHPPGKPDKTRLPELDAVTVPVLVVQGLRDPFGLPEPAGNREVVTVAGNHSLSSDMAAVTAAASTWLTTLLRP